MPGQREDLVGLFDHVWGRFWRRMDGLDDEEWRWRPTADPRMSLRWRLLHIADELIHHTAEAALLRDLFAARPSSPAAGRNETGLPRR